MASKIFGNKAADKANAIRRNNNNRRELQMATQGLAKGGIVTGPGTTKSDSVKANLDGNSLVLASFLFSSGFMSSGDESRRANRSRPACGFAR